MLTIKNEFISGAEIPRKGRLLLTDTISLKVQMFAQITFLFKNSGNNISSDFSLDFMPSDLIQKSIERLVRDYYAPFTGWFEMDGADLYVAWDNYEGDIYLPKAPLSFETVTINTSYDEFCNMVKRNDPSLGNSKVPLHVPLPTKGTPLLYFKFTRLGPDNQALSISITASHMLGDGASFSRFCENWAKLCCQISSTPSILSSSDLTDYSIPYPPLFGSVDLSKYRPKGEHSSHSTDDKPHSDSSIQKTASSLVKVIDRCFGIPPTEQVRIREEAHSEGLSFNMYLFGILWKELIAVYLYHNPNIINKISHFNIVADCRQIFRMPMGVCTDASIVLPVDISVSEILEANAIDLARIIKSKSIAAATPENICKAIDDNTSLWKQACFSEGDTSTNFNRQYFGSLMSIPNFCVSSWLNLKQTGADFGSGYPVIVRLPENHFNGDIYIMPPIPDALDGTMVITVAIPEDYDISKSSFLSEFVVKE